MVWNEFTGKHMALIPFTPGAFILLYYYVRQRSKEINENQPVTNNWFFLLYCK
jgi:hypothetical protein